MSSPTRVHLSYDTTDDILASEPARWARAELEAALDAAGAEHRGVAAAEADLRVTVVAPGMPEPALPKGIELPKQAESFAIFESGNGIVAWGNDTRGVVYALTELADRVVHGFPDGLAAGLPMVETPANRIRSVARIFANEREDKGWFQDRGFWIRYLTMLASNRFNRFSLTLGIQYDYPYHNNIISDVYLHFPYPYLVRLDGYDIRVRELPEVEREDNLELLRFIGREAARRGLDFQLGLWTQRYDFDDVPHATYTVEGVTEENNAPYCRDAVAYLLKEVPEITGLTFRIHVEGGVSEGDYDFWRTVFDGVRSAGRPIEIDMHAKGLDDDTLAVARESGMPVSVSPKYLAEHMGLPYHTSALRDREYPPKEAITNREKLSIGTRRFTRHSYGDFLRVGRDWRVTYRMWPGTQRVLTWGDPTFAAAYGRSGSFCDSDGIELMEPLTFKGRQGSGIGGGRVTLKQPGLATRYDWEKYAYHYRLWGRLLFNPETGSDGWKRFLRTECGKAAEAVERGMAAASRILPLITHAHGPSVANNNYWPENYTNMSIATEGLRRPMGFDMDEPTRFGNAPTFDPQMFLNGRQLAAALLKGEAVRSYTPMDVADWLTALASEAEAAAIEIRGSASAQRPAVKRLLADMQILASLGRYFAGKFRGSCWGEIYLATWSEPARLKALEYLRAARDGWKAAVDHSHEVYQDDLTFGPGAHMRGSWKDRLADIDREVKDLATFSLREWPQPDFDAAAGARAMAVLAGRGARSGVEAALATPASFRRGDAIEVTLEVPGAAAGVARLHYRQVHQGERWASVPMTEGADGVFSATIPAGAVDGPYHVQCFASLEHPILAEVVPGFAPTLSNQPYLVIEQTATVGREAAAKLAAHEPA